jgi:hypothetical protein
MASEHVKIDGLLIQEFESHPAWNYVQPRGYAESEPSTSFLHFFPVDNTAAPGADTDLTSLRSVLAAKISTEPYVRRQVPFTWLEVYKKLRSKVSTKGPENLCLSLSLQTVREEARLVGVVEKKTVLLMLKLFNELGLVMHHSEPALRHIVILDPGAFLVEPASRIICQRKEHELSEQNVCHHVQRHESVRQKYPREYKLYYKQGKLNKRLLALFWSDMPPEQRDDIEKLMVLYGLMIPLLMELKTCDTKARKMMDLGDEVQEYLVPSMLPPSVNNLQQLGIDPIARAVFIFGRKDSLDRWCTQGFVTAEEIRSEGFLPAGLFPQVTYRITAFPFILV